MKNQRKKKQITLKDTNLSKKKILKEIIRKSTKSTENLKKRRSTELN